MPNRPDKSVAAIVSSPSAATSNGVMQKPLRHFCLACTGGANRVILAWHKFS
jgi:hypothetical protein